MTRKEVTAFFNNQADVIRQHSDIVAGLDVYTSNSGLVAVINEEILLIIDENSIDCCKDSRVSFDGISSLERWDFQTTDGKEITSMKIRLNCGMCCSHRLDTRERA